MKRVFSLLAALLFWGFISGQVLPQESNHSSSEDLNKGEVPLSGFVPGDSATLISPEKYASVISRFETETLGLAADLDSLKTNQIKLQNQIQVLEAKVKSERENNPTALNVFENAKLNNILSDLQQKLEANSKIEKTYQQTRSNFEQKALSLLSLYNDWIDANLASASNAASISLDERLNLLVQVVKKRAKIKYLLQSYRTSEESVPVFNPADFKELDTQDRESKQLAMDLLRDRKKTLEDRLDRLALEVDEIKNEIKLQGKMQDFLEDIQRMNEDSSFPRGSLKRNDLQSYMGKNSTNGLEGRLAELGKEIYQDRQSLTQMDSSIVRLEGGVGEKKGGRP